MKFYTYKNGDIAFFENNEKMLISKEEKEMLCGGNRDYDPITGEANFTELYFYIKENTGKNLFSEILSEYRKNTYEKTNKMVNVNGNEISVTLVKENGDIVLITSKFGDTERTISRFNSNFQKNIAQLHALGVL